MTAVNPIFGIWPEIINRKINVISDDFHSLNNSKFAIDDYFERICPIELEIKDTIDTWTSASDLDLQMYIYLLTIKVG